MKKILKKIFVTGDRTRDLLHAVRSLDQLSYLGRTDPWSNLLGLYIHHDLLLISSSIV